MAISFVGNTTGSASTVTVSGCQVGDLLLVFTAAYGTGASSCSTSSGGTSAWTPMGTASVYFAAWRATVTTAGSVSITAYASSDYRKIGVVRVPAGEWSGTPTVVAFQNDADSRVSVTCAAGATVVWAGTEKDYTSLGSTVTPAGSTQHLRFSPGLDTTLGVYSWTGQAAGSRPYGYSDGSGSYYGVAVAFTVAPPVMSGSAVGAVDIAGAGSGVQPRHGTASGGLAVAGAATGREPAGGAATAGLDIAGAAEGAAPEMDSAAGTLDIDGAAAGSTPSGGAADGGLAVAGAATGIKIALAAGTLSVAGAGSGSVHMSGTAGGGLSLAAAAVGQTTPEYGTAKVKPRPLAEVIAGSHLSLARVRLMSGPAAGAVLPVVDGKATIAADVDVRLTGSLTVAGLEEWLPADASDALDPRARTEMVLEQGVIDDEGQPHWWALGVVHPTSTDVDSSGEGLRISCTVDDRALWVNLAGIDRTWGTARGVGYMRSVRDVLAYVAPWLPVAFDLAEDVPAVEEFHIVEPGADVWSRCRELLASVGRALHVNADGVAVAPLRTDPLAAAPTDLPVLVSWTRSTDDAAIVNVVGCRWEEPQPDDAPEGWQPDSGWVYARDDQSSTRVDVVGQRLRVASPGTTPGTMQEAQLLARMDLVDRLDLQRQGGASCVPHPDLTVDTVIEHDGDRYRVTSLDVDLKGSPTGVGLGALPPSWSRLVSSALKPARGGETVEVVTGLSPLRSRPVAEPAGPRTEVGYSDAVRGVQVGDIIVVSTVRGRRMAARMVTQRKLEDSNSGDEVATVNGKTVTVGGSVNLSAGDVGAATEQDVSNVEADVNSLDSDYSGHRHVVPSFYVEFDLSPTLSGTGRANASSLTLAALNESRADIRGLWAWAVSAQSLLGDIIAAIGSPRTSNPPQ